jgi:hypothetical protein
MRLRTRIVSATLALSLIGGSAASVFAANPTQVSQNGAVGLVAAVVSALNNVNVDDTNIDVAVVELNDSLNNLTALNNVLNNSPILSNNDIIDDVTLTDVNVLSIDQSEVLNDFLNNNDIDITAVVGVVVLGGLAIDSDRSLSGRAHTLDVSSPRWSTHR